MNIYECKELFLSMNPGKNIDFDFDAKCIRKYEVIYTDGMPNDFHHVEHDKVKVTVDGKNPIYVNIDTHRENISWEGLKNLVST